MLVGRESGRHECRWMLTGRDTLDTATTSETTDSGLGDTLDVVTKNLPVALGTTLAEALAALAACCGRDASVENLGTRREDESQDGGDCTARSWHGEEECNLRPVMLMG